MDDLSFLASERSGSATITVSCPDGRNQTLTGLNLDIIQATCPLLGHSFEDSWRGLQLSIQASSPTLIICFLRFLYTRDCTPLNVPAQEESISLLLHAELCRLGEIYDVPELMVQSHCKIIYFTELACSRPEPPDDLCEAIRFIYEHLSEQRRLIDTLLNYCVSCFLYHGLSTREEFRQLAYELRPFHDDLCRTNFRRGFEDDGAMDIIRLPVCEQTQKRSLIEEEAALGAFLFDLWGENLTPTQTPRLGPRIALLGSTATSVYRPRDSLTDTSEESDGFISNCELSDAEGYSVVLRPKGGPVHERSVSSDGDDDWFGIDDSPKKKLLVQRGVDQNASRCRAEKDLRKIESHAGATNQADSSDAEWIWLEQIGGSQVIDR